MKPVNRLVVSLFVLCLPILFINCSGGSSSETTPTPAAPSDESNNNPNNNPNNNDPAVVAKGSRVLGVDIVNESAGSNFTQNVASAQSLGAEYFILDMSWNQVEPGGSLNCNLGTYTDPFGTLAGFNAALPALNIKMTLNFSLSTTNIWGLPSIFTPSTFTADPNSSTTQTLIGVMVCRYANAINYVMSKMPNVQITSIQIGNEIDYLPEATNTNFWINYWSFLAQTATHVRTLRTPSITTALPIGVTASLSGLTGGKGETIRLGLNSLNSTISDFVSANFYPFETGGSQAKIDLIGTQLTNLISAAGSKPVRIQEFGCQSGTISNSSSELQKKCFQELFTVWDKNPTKLTHVNILRMNDLSHSGAYGLASTYIATPPADFVDYLETLGLKTHSGTEKEAFTYLKEQLKKRGW